MEQWLREPGRGRYARLEREVRVVLPELPADLWGRRRIDDRYLDGTTLRLRRVSDDDAVVYKLTQKVRPDPEDPSVVSLTNVYLTQNEYELLAGLPGRTLSKVRHAWLRDGHSWAVDELSGRWEGLVLAELELDEAGDTEPVLPHGFDVTHDDRFSGGALARATDDEAERLLAVARAAADGTAS